MGLPDPSPHLCVTSFPVSWQEALVMGEDGIRGSSILHCPVFSVTINSIPTDLLHYVGVGMGRETLLAKWTNFIRSKSEAD